MLRDKVDALGYLTVSLNYVVKNITILGSCSSKVLKQQS